MLKPLPYEVIEEQIKSGKQLDILYGILRILRKYADQADVFHVDGFMLYGAGLYRWLGGRVPVFVFFNRELTVWPDEVSSSFRNLSPRSFWHNFKKRVRWYIERYVFMCFAGKIFGAGDGRACSHLPRRLSSQAPLPKCASPA